MSGCCNVDASCSSACQDRTVIMTVMLVFLCRVARTWNQTGDKWAHLADVSDWLVRQVLTYLCSCNVHIIVYNSRTHYNSRIVDQQFGGYILLCSHFWSFFKWNCYLCQGGFVLHSVYQSVCWQDSWRSYWRILMNFFWGAHCVTSKTWLDCCDDLDHVTSGSGLQLPWQQFALSVKNVGSLSWNFWTFLFCHTVLALHYWIKLRWLLLGV